MKGIFTISLDFELHWGVFDKKNRQSRKRCYENTLRVIPEMLELFAKYDVHVTWASVGSLFVKNEMEWMSSKPAIEPQFRQKEYSAYEWVKKNTLADEFHWAHFAPETIKLIQQYPGQEIGTHTFAHYYCLEPDQRAEAFGADLDAAKKLIEQVGGKMLSLVFPRNQFNAEYLQLCFSKGIKTVRSNPSDWFWTAVSDEDTSLIRKIFRTGDSYVALGKRSSYPLSSIDKKEGEPIQLPASRFLRPWMPKYSFTNLVRLRRVIHELREAARKNECYHLWWHPENFGDHPEENMKDLRVILAEFDICKKQWGMMSWNMGEYARHFGV